MKDVGGVHAYKLGFFCFSPPGTGSGEGKMFRNGGLGLTLEFIMVLTSFCPLSF